MVTRAAVLAEVAGRIVTAGAEHVVRVAIDGVDAAGKTTLADELAPLVQERGRPVIRASIDDFHHPQAKRYRRGPLSPEGYFLDSFDLPVLIASLLAPLGPKGNGRYTSAVFDYRVDAPVHAALQQAPPGAILLFDGIFLARPELVDYWDLFIFVRISFETCLVRAVERNKGVLNPEEIIRQYQTRYIPAQRRYLATCRPEERADIIIDNNEPARPGVWGLRLGAGLQPPAPSP